MWNLLNIATKGESLGQLTVFLPSKGGIFSVQRDAGHNFSFALNGHRPLLTVSQLPPPLGGVAVLHPAFELAALLRRRIPHFLAEVLFHRLSAVLPFFEELFSFLRWGFRI